MHCFTMFITALCIIFVVKLGCIICVCNFNPHDLKKNLLLQLALKSYID